MATYTMTPRERALMEKARREERERERSVYSFHRNAVNQQKAAAARSAAAQSPKKDSGALVKAGHTVADLVMNVIEGASKGLEGIFDLGAGAVGAVGGIFDDGFQDRVKDLIAYDATGRVFNPIQEALDYSVLKEDGIIENVAGGIGQMLPAVAVSLATAGIGAAAGASQAAIQTASQAASLATMGVSAAGSGTEEAFNDGAEYGEGLAYGAVTGGIEAATEKMFGGVTKGLVGAGVLDGTKKAASVGLKSTLKSMGGEAVEEMISEAASPAAKTIYKGKAALEEYKSPEFIKNVGKAGIVGGLTDVAFGNTVGRIPSLSSTGKRTDIKSSLDSISELREQAAEYHAEGKSTEKITAEIEKANKNIENTLKKLSPEKRKKYIEEFGLSLGFEADGTVRKGADSEKKYKKENYSYNLDGFEDDIADDLEKISSDLKAGVIENAKRSGKVLTEDEASAAVGDISVLEREMSEEGKAEKKRFEHTLRKLNKISGVNTPFVILEENDRINGLNVDGRLYIGADAFEKGGWGKVLVHEYTHLEEGTAEYEAMARALESDEYTVEVDTKDGKKRVTLAEAAIDSVMKKSYNISKAEIEKILEKKKIGLELSREEKSKLGLYESEKTAHSTEILLGNEKFIERIMQSDAGLAKKLFIRITNLAKSLGNSDSKAAREELKRLKHAQELYLKAAEKVGNAEFKRIMQLLDDEEEAEGENIKASFKGYSKDGRGMYESNFPKGTPKKAKAEKILSYIQNVWSKKPIKLNITDSDGNIVRSIEAQFDPYYTEKEGIRTDASKLMGGNRHGTAAEKRVTLDLADDYYKIASEAVYNYSKKEIGKDSATHEGVKEWHYFVNDIYFAEKESEDYEPYTVTINVKEKDNGSFVYSFSAEKSKESITRQTLHADVTNGKPLSNDGLSIDSITEKAENVNSNEKKSPVKYSLKESEDAAEEKKSGVTVRKIDEQLAKDSAFGSGENASVDRGFVTERIIERGLPGEKGRAKMSVGRMKQFMSNYAGWKTFSKQSVLELVEKFSGIQDLSLQTRAEITEAIWQIMNEPMRYQERQATAREIAEFITAKMLTDVRKTNPEFKDAEEKLSYIKYGIGRISLTEAERSEISHILDKDGLRHIVGRWGYKNLKRADGKERAKKPILMEVFVTDIAREMPGMQYLEDMNPVEAFLEIENIYTQAKTIADEKSLLAYGDMSDSEIAEMVKGLENSIMQIYREGGKDSRFRERLKNKVDSAYKNMKERRELADAKRGMYRAFGRLNTRLIKPSKEKHIPDAMREIVADSLGALNLTPKSFERLENIQQSLEKLYREDVPNSAVIKALEAKRDELEQNGLQFKEQMKALYDAYIKFGKNEEGTEAWMAYDSDVADKLEEFLNAVGNTPVYDFTLVQAKAARMFYEMLLHRVNTANQAFKDEKTAAINEAAALVIDEIRAAKAKGLLAAKTQAWKIRNVTRAFLINNMKPPHFFDMLGSDMLTSIYEGLHKGELQIARDIETAKEFLEKIVDKYNYYSWDGKARTDFISLNGRSFSLTLGQIMSIYAYLKREQAHDHLRVGGFKFAPNTEKQDKVLKSYINDATRYTLDEQLLSKISDTLTSEQKKFVDEMVEYLSKDVAAWGNEVSLELYGIKLFGEEFYFPMKCANEYLDSQTGKQGEPKIKNKGMAKPVTPHAENPLILGDFLEIWGSHINEMALYHGMVLPTENFNRVLNYRGVKAVNIAEAGDVGELAELGTSVKQALQEKYGSEIEEYIRKLLVDVNGGIRPYNSLGGLDTLLTNFKRVSTMASLSVFIQQFSSLPRAMAIIDPKYFAALPKLLNRAAKLEEMKKYAPIVILKEMGGFDTGTGRTTSAYLQSREYRGFDKLRGFLKDKNYRDGAFGYLASMADEVTWVQIWEACVREQRELYIKESGKKISIEEFRASEKLMQKVGDRFDYVITRTQVYDSTLSRSAHMRSRDGLAKMATAFMAEPTTVFSMLFAGLSQKRQGKKVFGRIVGSVIAATIVNSLLAAIVYAARDDDEEKSYAEKYLLSFVEQTKDSFNPLMSMPITRDIVSIMQGYDIERTDMAPIADLYTAINKLIPKKEGDAPTIDEGLDFIGSVGSIFGIPTRNILRDARAAVNTFSNVVNGERTSAAGLRLSIKQGITGKTITNGQQLYEAKIKGDEKQYHRVAARFETEMKADAALRVALRDNDKRIEEAAMFMISGDKASSDRIVSEIAAEGHFTIRNIKAAIQAEYNSIKKELEDTGTVIFFEDEMYKMSEGEVALLSENRSAVENELTDLTDSSVYEMLSAEQAENALAYAKKIADELAIYKTFGREVSKAVMLADLLGLDFISAAYELAREIEADVDEDGKTVSGSKKKKIQDLVRSLKITAAEKYILMGFFGYKNAKGRAQVEAYLGRAGLSKEEKTRVMKICGYS